MKLAWARLDPRRRACLFAAVAGALLGFLPLFGGPGYEIALAYGVLLPSAAAIASALATPAASPTRGLLDGLVTGAAVFAVALLVSFLHLLHAPACEPFSSAGYVMLSAGVGTLLGGLWGSAIRELGRPGLLAKRWRRVLAALAAPVGGVVISLARFYGAPMIFAFDPFAGYFSGTLYDTVVEPGPTLWLYRFGSACTVVGVLLVSLSLVRVGAQLRVRLRAGPFALGAALLLVSIGFWLFGSRFDFVHDASTIAEGLGGRLDGARCTVLFPRTLEARDAALLLRDCEDDLTDVERVLGARGPERLTAFFFRDPAEKKRYMGAANTYIAKPWRNEVYLQLASYPHPVLGHEIAHVVAGSFGSGPFRIGGLLPNPGLIEGVATSASPDDDALTDVEWCKAMKDENLLPRISSLFSLSFLGQQSSRAYTVAGAFVGYVRDRFGAKVVRDWYGGADLAKLTERSWSDLENDFRAHLDTLPMTETSRAYARAKFGKPGVFGRRCPHLLDRLRGEGEGCARDHDLEGAEKAFTTALHVDPSDARTRLDVANLAFTRGDLPGADARYQELLADPSAQVRERARDQYGDVLLLQGKYEEAAALFEVIAQESEDEDLARSASVKVQAARDPLLRSSVLTLLVGLPPTGTKSPLLAGALLADARTTTARASALVAYLIGKNLVQSTPDTALPYLRTAFDERAALDPKVRRELARQLAVAGCATRAADVLATVRSELEAQPQDGRTTWILRLIRRCQPPTP